MSSDKHKERVDYARKYFENYEGGRFHFKEIRIANLENTLKEISGKSEGVRPDLLMMYHHNLYNDLTAKEIKIPNYISIKWIEVYETNFQSFPKYGDLKEALYRTITLRDLYDPEDLKKSLFGKGIHTRADLYGHLKENCRIEIIFYLVQEDTIWECKQIDPQVNKYKVPDFSLKKEKSIEISPNDESVLKKLADLLRLDPKPNTIFSDIISLFQNNIKLKDLLNMEGYVEPDFVQIENNLWSFFTACRFEKSKIIIGKARHYNYVYDESEPEKNIEIRNEFIEYIFSRIN